jgi:hypothetical protein
MVKAARSVPGKLVIHTVETAVVKIWLREISGLSGLGGVSCSVGRWFHNGAVIDNGSLAICLAICLFT